MKKSFPHFPHSTKAAEKEWDDTLLGTSNLSNFEHPVVEELRRFYPYIFYIDVEGGRITFKNREYQLMKKPCRKSEDENWCRFDVKGFMNLGWPTEESQDLDVPTQRGFLWDNDHQLDDGEHFTEYLRRLIQIEQYMNEVSPFQRRFALTIKRAYELKSENIELRKQLEMAERDRKYLRKELKRQNK